MLPTVPTVTRIWPEKAQGLNRLRKNDTAWYTASGMCGVVVIGRAFSPHGCPLSTETQADGLGWYGVAPSVLGFAATWSSTLEE